MSELSKQVTIANRNYPLKIKGGEEAIISAAEKLISERLNELGKKYGVKDIQDLLAMCILQFATESLNQREKSSQSGAQVKKELKELESFIDSYLEKENVL